MAMTFTQLKSRLRAISKEAKEEIAEIIEFNGGKISDEAILNAPSAGDDIPTQSGTEKYNDIVGKKGWVSVRQAIGYKVTEKGMKVTISVDERAGDIAAWIEFGTGQSAKSYLVTVPPEWRELAQKYIINRRGTIIANPYLYPAFFKYQQKYIEEVKDYVKTISI